jgi:hypothetical protein
MNFFREVWTGYRSYLVKFAIDFAISGTLWLGLFVFQGLTRFLPVTDWAGSFIVHLHSAGIVGAVGVFAVLSVADIVSMRKGGLLCLA